MANKRDEVEAVTDFIFLGSKITAESDWSHEIKRHLLLGRKAIMNLGSELKSRDIILVTEVQIYGFSRSQILMWELDRRETWVPKDWCFQTVVLERLLSASWTARRSKQSILKEINPEYSLEGLMLKLKLQYFGHLMWGADILEKTLILGKTEGRRRRGWQRMRWLDSTTDSTDMNLRKTRKYWRTGEPALLQSMGWQRAGHNLATEQYNNKLHKGSIIFKPTFVPFQTRKRQGEVMYIHDLSLSY